MKEDNCIMTERGALRQAVDLSLEQLLVIYLNNRHLAEWRLLRFTMIVIVNDQICKVIRTGIYVFILLQASFL